MKIFLISLLLYLTSSIACAQSNIRLNNLWSNPYYINVASVDESSFANMSVAVRKQWLTFPGSPTTSFASARFYFDDFYTQLGFKLIQDKIGYISTTELNLSYSYTLVFYSGWHMHLGVGGSYQALSYDLSKVSSEIDFDPLIYDKLNFYHNFNSDAGLEITNRGIKFGLSTQNMFSIFNETNRLRPNTNFAYAIYRQTNDRFLNIGMGVVGIQYDNMFQAEFSTSAYFKVGANKDALQLGVFYRTIEEMGGIVGFDIGKFAHISYSYDFNIGGISRNSLGTHELIFNYKIDRKKNCKHCDYYDRL